MANKNNKDTKRGETFVGYRPSVIKNKKDKENSRQARKKERKKETKRRIDDWER